MKKKKKIELVRWYFGLTIKEAKKYVEEYDKDNPNGKVYELILDYLKRQAKYEL